MRRLTAVAVLAAVTAVRGDLPPSRSWRDGPVRYLLTEDEQRRFARLRTPEARQAWVDRFWRRLDPDPATPRNEFQERFEARVAETDRFREPLTPGWRTDRGRVLLLAGAPTAIRRDHHDPVAVEREVWTYGSEPSGSRGPVEVIFYRDAQGRFRLDPERPQVQGVDPEQIRIQAMARAMRTRGSPEVIHMFVQLIQESEARARVWPPDAPTRAEPGHGLPPPQPQVEAGAYLRTGSWFFRAADGSVLAVFAADAPLPGGALPEAAVWVWRAAEGMGGGSLHVPLDLAEESGAEEGWGRFTGRAHLDPGVYELRFAVREAGGTLRVHSDRIDVPELERGALSASSVVPAERFGPVSPGNANFAVGSEEVVPRPGATFRRSEPLRLYFQLYGAAPDAATLRPRVDLRVQFSRVGRRLRRQGEPFVVRGASGASLGLSLPVGNWPPGEYQARIDLHDRVSGQRASTTGTFRIE
ncbi:MAG TPA: GWxTD domain-containing protein [Candidatus Polarisedimenticolaceae bacterium]|nr:GWxTD domain-containing protein [Candidatus Polarisedimenticolaceae bacterium]